MAATPAPDSLPDQRGRFGAFGGRYAPEVLIPALEVASGSTWLALLVSSVAFGMVHSYQGVAGVMRARRANEHLPDAACAMWCGTKRTVSGSSPGSAVRRKFGASRA